MKFSVNRSTTLSRTTGCWNLWYD